MTSLTRNTNISHDLQVLPATLNHLIYVLSVGRCRLTLMFDNVLDFAEEACCSECRGGY